MKEVSDGVAGGNLTRRVRTESRDEIGEMSSQFNSLIDRFEQVLKRIKDNTKVLLGSVQDLSVSSQEISSTSNQQAAAVKEIVSTMEDSDELSKSIASKIDEVTKIAYNTKEAVEGGFTIIKQSLDRMNEIKDANAATIEGIRSLGEKINSIWEIVNIINGIADQTKIIAFNAELEASAAGEAGKNFQIVAGEIRRLADSTVSSTNEIKTKINEIQHSSDNLIIASEEGTEKVTAGWQLSNDLRSVFEDILSSSEISAKSAEQIALSINQQVSAFEQILQTLKQISEGIDNFVTSTKSTTKATEELKNMADVLNGVVEEYTIS
jgi:methyl-accepting chemotaxis protein